MGLHVNQQLFYTHKEEHTNITKLSFNLNTMECLSGDSLTYSNKMKFSTLDQDNDKAVASCSTHWKSAGWFNNCFLANPNGQYTDSEKTSSKYINWHHWKNSYIALKNIQLMIRPRA